MLRRTAHAKYGRICFVYSQVVRQWPGVIFRFTYLGCHGHRQEICFASLTKGLYVMGGFLDVNLLTVTGDSTQADINTDINFKADPEATKIALTADFPNISEFLSSFLLVLCLSVFYPVCLCVESICKEG